MAMINREHKLIYVAHIPRTGGHAVGFASTDHMDHNGPRYNAWHVDWRIARDAFGSEAWNTYFKFALVRNPFDLLPSLYYLPNRIAVRKARPTWKEFVRDPILKPTELQTLPQSNIIGPNVDFIIKFENLAENFEKMLTAANVPRPYSTLPPPTNSSDPACPAPNLSTHGRLPYWEYYTESWMIESVYENFAEDFERFDYDWAPGSIA